MSALGQKQTFAVHQPMSALPPKADSAVQRGMSAKGHKRTSSCSIPLALFLSLGQRREPQPLLRQVTESLFCECVHRTLCTLLAFGSFLAVDLRRRWHRRTFGYSRAA